MVIQGRKMTTAADTMTTATHTRRLTKSEQEAAKKKEELAAQRKLEDEERRKQEDKIIAQIEKEFWQNSQKIAEGKAEHVPSAPRCGPGIPNAAPSLDALISDDDLDRLIQFMEAGNEITLDPRPSALSGLPPADEETVLKAQQLVETLAASLSNAEKREVEKSDNREQRVREEQARIARGEECELERLYREEQEERTSGPSHEPPSDIPSSGADLQAAAPCSEHETPEATQGLVEPVFNVQVVEDSVVVKVELPLVKSAREIDAEVVDGKTFELAVDGVYFLRTTLPITIDEEGMSCKFDKKKKTLAVNLPALA